MKRIIRKTSTILSALALTLSAFSPYTGVYAEEPAADEEIIEEENPSYEETDYAAAIAQSGLFYLDAGTNQIGEGSSALFRIARGGENLPAAHVKLSLIDISAKYGEDYEIRVLAQTDVIPQVPQEMTSILEEIENSDEAVEEIYAEDTEVAPQQLTEEDAQAFGDLIGEQLSQYAAKHPDEYVIAAEDASSVKETGRSALSEAFSQATGLEDDALPMSSDGSAVLDVNALMAGYTVDTIDELSTAFSSAYVMIDFEEGQRETLIEIRSPENEEAKGDLLFMAAIFGADTDTLISEINTCTFSLKDNEEYTAPAVSFSEVEYTGENGYVNVTLNRSGVVSGFSSVRLYTEDETAQSGRDYSGVDAVVSFPLGVTKRTIRIPVRSKYLTSTSEFGLHIDSAENCEIETAEAYGVISRESGDYEIEKAPETAQLQSHLPEVPKTSGGNPVSFDLSDGYAWSYADASAGYNGSVIELKANGWTWDKGKCSYNIGWLYDESKKYGSGYLFPPKAFKAVRVDWEKSGEGSSTSRVILITNDSNPSYDVSKDSFDRTEQDFAIPYNRTQWTGFEFYNDHNGSPFEKASKLKVYEVSAVPRPIQVKATVYNNDSLRFIGPVGYPVDWRAANLPGVGSFLISGNTRTATHFIGDTVTVSTDDTYTYIKSLYVGNERITPVYPAGTSSVSFKIDNDFFRDHDNEIHEEKIDNESWSAFEVRVELGQYDADIYLDNNDVRGSLELAWPTNRNGIHKGDWVAIRQRINSNYSSSWTQSRIRMQYKTSPSGKTYDAFFKFDQGSSDVLTFRQVYYSLTASPVFDKKDNQLVVRVKDTDMALFDQNYGIFANPSEINEAGYHDYIIASKDKLQAGTRYELSVKPKNQQTVALWTSSYKENTVYCQNNWWFTAQSIPEENLVFMRPETADDIPYSLSGVTRYANYSMVTGSEGDTWMAADGVIVRESEEIYGVSDENGEFRVIPMYGIEGLLVQYQVRAMGNTEYRTARLNRNGTIQMGEITAYDTDIGSLVVSPVNKDVPYPSAVSLETEGSANSLVAFLGSPGSGGESNKFTVFIANDNHEYTDEEGNTKTEQVKRVQLFAYDPLSNIMRGQIGSDFTKLPGVEGSSSVWQLDSHLEAGTGLYEPGDRIYVRVTTDREKAIILDADGNPVDNELFKETAWPDLYTGMTLSSVESEIPPEYDMDFMDTDLNRYFELPFFDMLNFTLLVKGVSVSFQELPGNVHRFSIGKILNEYNPGNDTKEDFNGFGDAVAKSSAFGAKVKGDGSLLPVTCGGFNPFLGLYIDFAPGTVTPDGGNIYNFELLGGGLYVGARLWGQVSFYLPICCVPMYMGANGGITAYANLGMKDTSTISLHTIKDGTADFDDAWDPDFMIKAEADLSFYGGVGVACTIGVRGGVLLDAQYIYNPTITTLYPDFDVHGGRFTANARIWVDLLYFSIVFPIKTFYDKPFGYIKQMDEMKQNSAEQTESSGGVLYRSASEPVWRGDRKVLMSKPDVVQETILQSGGYDRADAKLLDMGENGTLLVYLSADPERPQGDQSVLNYSVYKDGLWSAPVRIGDERTLSTADYQPDVCDAGGSVMISWVSRKDAPYENSLEYLGLMDVYTCLFDKQTHEISAIECLSEGDYPDVGYYNCAPRGVYDELSGDRLVYYQKSAAEIKAVDESLYEYLDEDETQLLANASPTQNGSFITYLLYDHTTGSWAKDHIYENEVSSEASRNYLINNWGGQRFLGSPIHEEDWVIDRPVIVDFDAISYNGVAVYAFSVDRDNSLDTDYDRDLFLQVYEFETHRTFHPVRITDDSFSDAVPQLIRTSYTDTDGSEKAHTWLIWLQGISMPDEEDSSKQVKGYTQVRYLDVAALIHYGINDDGTIGANGYSIEDEAHLFSYAGMNPIELPSFSNFHAYVDAEDNLYLMWSDEVRDDENSHSQEIFASALIDRRNGSSWSVPVQITDSGMVYDEIAAAVNQEGKLILVSNRYSLDLESETAGINDYCLTASVCEDGGSLEAVGAGYSNALPLPGETITADVAIQNTGLKASGDYALKVYEVHNGVRSAKPVYSRGTDNSFNLFSWFDVNAEEPETETERINPGATVTETFEWTIPSDIKEGDTLALYAEVTEKDAKINPMKSAEVGEITFMPQYQMSNVTVTQTPEGFKLQAELKNTGNVASSADDVSFKAEFNDLYHEGLEGTWLNIPIPSLEPGESILVEEILDIDDRFLKHGFANGFADLRDKNGEDLMIGTDFIAALEYPYHIVVNDDPELEEIELKVGESIELSGVYGPADYYLDGTVAFTPVDSETAYMEGNRLVANEAGETWLRVYVAPYGGDKMIRIRISSDSKPLDPEPSADPDDKTVEPSGGSANTSDTNNVPLYTGILAASLMAAIALLLYRKKLSR